MSQSILVPGFLYWDGFKYVLEPGTFTPNGDLSGDAINQTVIGIEMHPVPPPTGVNTVLTWDGYFFWAPAGGGGSFTPGGDLSGSSTVQTVISISGPSPIIVSPNEFRWVVGASPLFDQATLPAANPGTNSTSVFTIASQAGGFALSGDTAGGNAGGISLAGGVGGNAFSHSPFNAIGGTGGNISLTGGNAGFSPGGGGSAGSTGGSVTIVGGDSFDNFGFGGTITLRAGTNAGVSSGAGHTATLTLRGADLNTFEGGAAILSSGQGGDGSVSPLHLQTGGTAGSTTMLTITGSTGGVGGNIEIFTVLQADYLVTFKEGQNVSVHALITSGPYNVSSNVDYYLPVGTLAAPLTINLPGGPTTGDVYVIKDANGSAAAFNITISGNGHNIDGAATFVMSNNYEAIVVTYTGTQWSVS